MTERQLREAAKHLLDLFRARGLRLATAESCTGGLCAAMLTAVAGSSAVVECSFVTYSNGAKQTMLGVPATTLKHHGAVSAETATAMAKGALKRSEADISVAVTGIAGPGGGSRQKPVGLVHFAAAKRGGQTIARERRFGKIGRQSVRLRSVAEAFKLMEALARESAPLS